jgi:hypothetical protein
MLCKVLIKEINGVSRAPGTQWHDAILQNNCPMPDMLLGDIQSNDLQICLRENICLMHRLVFLIYQIRLEQTGPMKKNYSHTYYKRFIVLSIRLRL